MATVTEPLRVVYEFPVVVNLGGRLYTCLRRDYDHGCGRNVTWAIETDGPFTCHAVCIGEGGKVSCTCADSAEFGRCCHIAIVAGAGLAGLAVLHG